MVVPRGPLGSPRDGELVSRNASRAISTVSWRTTRTPWAIGAWRAANRARIESVTGGSPLRGSENSRGDALVDHLIEELALRDGGEGRPPHGSGRAGGE